MALRDFATTRLPPLAAKAEQLKQGRLATRTFLLFLSFLSFLDFLDLFPPRPSESLLSPESLSAGNNTTDDVGGSVKTVFFQPPSTRGSRLSCRRLATYAGSRPLTAPQYVPQQPYFNPFA